MLGHDKISKALGSTHERCEGCGEPLDYDDLLANEREGGPLLCGECFAYSLERYCGTFHKERWLERKQRERLKGGG